MDDLKALAAPGFTLPSPAYLFGLIFFAIPGHAGYRHRKRAALPLWQWPGVAPMLSPCAIDDTGWLHRVGAGRCALPFVLPLLTRR